MMPSVIESLKRNWGDKAIAMNCYVEVKYTLSDSRWACYIYAMDPEEPDKILCILKERGHVQALTWSLKDLEDTFDMNGENPVMDHEFRRIRASELFKKLSEEI